ncbi:MAG: hypothetical protein GC162_05510 [Planctomycetes bacterium]|nr:hypothetical protein [Planctomycetota bacterium]
MKLKNIGFFELHFEKFLGGLAVIVILFAVYRYGMNTPNVVELNGQQVTAKDVDPLVLGEAKRLSGVLNSNEVHQALRDLTVPSYTENFAAKIKQPPVPDSNYALAFSSVTVFDNIKDTGVDLKNPMWEPVIPAPSIVAVRADLGTFAPEEVQNNTALRTALKMTEAPYDTSWVSVAGQYDMKALKDELNKKEDEQHRAIPQTYIDNTFAFADVQIARQQMNPDGTWPADDKYEIVPAMPSDGIVSFRDVPRKVDGQAAGQYLAAMRQYQSVVMQPPFPEVVGTPWAPPEAQVDVGVGGGDNATQLSELKRQMRVTSARMQMTLQNIDRLRNPKRAVVRPPAGGVRPPAGGGEFEGGPGEFGPPPTVAPGGSGTNVLLEKRIARLNEQVDKYKVELQQLQDKVDLLSGKKPGTTATPAPGAPRLPVAPGGEFPGPGVPGGPDGFAAQREMMMREGGLLGGGEFGEFGAAAPAPGAPAGGAGANMDIFHVDKISIWSSDLNAKPGKTYRYKMRVVVTNVLFNKPDLPEDQKKANADKFLVESTWSAWSKPVKVEQTRYYFATNASPQPAPGQATLEVWRFYNGQWRSQEFAVRPGGPIGATIPVAMEDGAKHDVNFFTGDYVVDMDFNYQVPARLGNLPRRTQLVLVLSDDMVTQHRVDMDRDSNKREQLKNQPTGGVAAAR